MKFQDSSSSSYKFTSEDHYFCYDDGWFGGNFPERTYLYATGIEGKVSNWTCTGSEDSTIYVVGFQKINNKLTDYLVVGSGTFDSSFREQKEVDDGWSEYGQTLYKTVTRTYYFPLLRNAMLVNADEECLIKALRDILTLEIH